MNSSITLGMSTGMLQYMCKSERKAVFIRFSPLNDLSAEHVVTGKVHMILISALMFGNIEVVCLRAMPGGTWQVCFSMLLLLLLPLYFPTIQLTACGFNLLMEDHLCSYLQTS